MNQTSQPEKSDNNTPTRKPLQRKILRRKFLLVVLIAAFCVYFYNPFKPRLRKMKKKLIILGFDGADPDLVSKWWDDLPNFRKLARMGSRMNMNTCFPPESPVAWSCFAVGGNAGRHGVYDFLRRPAGSYMPSIESFVAKGHAKFLWKMLPIKMPKAIFRRGGTAFWDVLSKNGIPTSLIDMPITFPPPKLNYGRVLAGLGVPDVRGMQATAHHFVYSKGKEDEKIQDSTFGVKTERLTKEGNTYSAFAWGPNDPVHDEELRELEKKQLDAILSMYEWEAHLKSLQGERFDNPEKRARSANYVSMRVSAKMAYHSYLHSEDLYQRVEALKTYFMKGTKYVKDKSVTRISKAREISHQFITEEKKIAKQLASDPAHPIKLPVTFKRIDSETVEIQVGKEKKQAKLNQWSEWFTLHFPIVSIAKARAICRFYPQDLSEDSFKIFMSSPDIDPRKPVIPISHPKSYSKELVDWTGKLFKTRGWAAETHGLKDGALEEDGFIDDLFDIMNAREAKLFETMERTTNNVIVSVFSATDRVSHMFYRFIDPSHPMHPKDNPGYLAKYENTIKKVYIKMDQIVGRMMKKIENDPDATLMVMSDHGFKSWRRQVHINKWLYDNGFLAIKGSGLIDSDMRLADLVSSGSDFFSYVDWSKTEAYSMGLGQIYINKKDREPMGIVLQNNYDALCESIASKFKTLKDVDGTSVVTHVKKREEIWSGKYADDIHDAPDLQVCFNQGYRVSWQTCLGGISSGDAIEDNLEKWSADHCSVAPEHVPGIFFCNKKIERSKVSLYDFAPTVLGYFGLKKPKEMEGRDLFKP